MTAPARPIRVVAFGGGHGLGASLRALRHAAREVELDITAIVTVGDDGGSSGRLRVERDALLPPGDLRQALAALADHDPTAQLTAQVMQHRFVAMSEPGVSPAPPAARGPRLERRADRSKDTLAGHTVGNLLLLGLMEMLGDPVRALDHAAAMVGARGRVLPMALHAVGIEADVTDGSGRRSTIRGQHSVAVVDGRVESVRLEPADPPACPQALEAVRAADWLIFGPGSWYTSVLPHLLVPGLAREIVASPARRLVTLNLGTDKETHGLSAAAHLATLHGYLPQLRVDTVLADEKWAGEPEPVRAAAQRMGAELVLAPVAVADGSPRHDPEALGVALVPVLGAAR
ncbi:putative cofD-like protein [Actinoplanes octamycinicus]|uniref:Putative gluconeogenesis factor n=1 Tax=Actinoplanes octamycinicus TaxID=135948 RepID=A0A7W7GXG1_9ACTN|nr:2-phospho-L-lactate transferase CofD family protein [Actinoplanes octamycinicus]MBB4739912.1 putative cofD-like protein [Actinoplanes octamycinicus]GIE55098.1 putative gluconeogenesis factor [Actinoplanes octamycinicus]